MPSTDVTIFNVESGTTDVNVVLAGAQARAQASDVTTFQQSNSTEVTLTGASTSAIPGIVNVGTGASDLFNPDFPRLGAMRIGERSYGDTPGRTGSSFDVNLDEVDSLARMHFSVINPQQGRGSEFVALAADWLARSDAINPDHFHYIYTDMQETGDVETQTTPTITKLLSETGPTTDIAGGGGGNWTPNDWMGRTTSGDLVQTFPSQTLYIVNPTVFVTPDSDGLIFPEWYADFIYARDFATHNSSGVRYHLWNDVNNHRVSVNQTDFNRNGVSDRQNSDWDLPGSEGEAMAAAFRQGHRIFADRLRSIEPNLLVACNTTQWSDEYTSPNPDDAPPIHTFYEGAYDGGTIEAQTKVDGNPFTGVFGSGDINPSGFGHWRLAQNNYQYSMRHVGGHTLNIYQIDFITTTLNPLVTTTNAVVSGGLQGTITPAAMATFRFGICSTLMDDGYMYATESDRFYNTTPYFDYYGTNPGFAAANVATHGLTKGYLGQRVGLPQSQQEDITKQSAVWLGSDRAGIHKAEFDNGLVLVNSTKSTTGSITIPVLVGADEANGELEAGKWRKISGYQDSIHDDGQVVNNNLTINSRDGYILLRV